MENQNEHIEPEKLANLYDKAVVLAAGLRNLGQFFMDYPHLVEHLAFTPLGGGHINLPMGGVRGGMPPRRRIEAFVTSGTACGIEMREKSDDHNGGVVLSFGVVDVHIYASRRDLADVPVPALPEYRPLLGAVAHGHTGTSACCTYGCPPAVES